MNRILGILLLLEHRNDIIHWIGFCLMMRNPIYFLVMFSTTLSLLEISSIISSYLSSSLNIGCCQFAIIGNESYSYVRLPLISGKVIFNIESSYIPYHELFIFSHRKYCPLLMVEWILRIFLLLFKWNNIFLTNLHLILFYIICTVFSQLYCCYFTSFWGMSPISVFFNNFFSKFGAW